MLHLFNNALNPCLALKKCIENWAQISMDLREQTRKRKLQIQAPGHALARLFKEF
jgi:hypothetical protein